MSKDAWLETALGGAFVCVSCAGPVLLYLVLRRTANGISRRLQRGRKVVRIRTSYSGGAWNPSRPLGRGNSTPNEPGTATYTLGQGGVVVLDLVRADGQGERYQGPLLPSSPRPNQRWPIVASLATYGLCGAVGFLIGFDTAGAPHRGHLIAAMIGLFLGAIAGWFVLAVASILGGRRRRAQPAPPP